MISNYLQFEHRTMRLLCAVVFLLGAIFPLLAPGNQLALPSVLPDMQQSKAVTLPPFFSPLGAIPGEYRLVGAPGQAQFTHGQITISTAQRSVAHAAQEARAVVLQFEQVNPEHWLEGDRRLAGVVNDYRGKNPLEWQVGAPTYASLVYRQLYPGIDLVYEATQGGFKGTYYVAAGADPAQITWRYQGAEAVRIAAVKGELRIKSGRSWLVDRAPQAWQTANGEQRKVPVRYHLNRDGSLSFSLGNYDPSLPLVIDPELVFGTYLGGSSEDYGRAVAVGADGAIYVVGDIWSTNFLGFDTSSVVNNDVLLIKLNADGKNFDYFTFIGGTGFDDGLDVALGPAGSIYLTADPFSGDFPTFNPITLPADDFSGDGMLVKLDANGNLVYSTPVGMNFTKEYSGRHIAVDQDGNVFVAGEGYNQFTVDRDAVIKKVNAAGSAITQVVRVAGNSSTRAASLALGTSGKLYITGSTDNWNEDLPLTAGAIQPVCGAKLADPNAFCQQDGFLLVYSVAGVLQYGTYLGGEASDEGRAVAVDSSGNIYVAGLTGSKDFPTFNALQPSCTLDTGIDSCYFDTFVVKLNSSGTSFIYSTYLTSTEKDRKDFLTGLAVDGAGNAYLTGYTHGETFPVKEAFQPQLEVGVCLTVWEDRLCFDAFVTRLNADGTLGYSSYLGGALDEYSGGIALDPQGDVVVVGYTKANNFPTTTDVLQPNPPAGSNFYVAKIGAASAPPPPPPPPPALNIRLYLPMTIR